MINPSPAQTTSLPHRDHHTREAGLVRRQEGDGLVVHPRQGARPFDDLPLEREIVLDAAPRTIARQGPQLIGLADPHHRRSLPRGNSAPGTHISGSACGTP